MLQSRMGVVSHPHMAADVAVGHRGNFRRAGRAHVDSEGGERPGGMPVSGRRESTPALPRAAVVAKLRNMPWLLEFKCAGPQRNRGALLAPKDPSEEPPPRAIDLETAESGLGSLRSATERGGGFI